MASTSFEHTSMQRKGAYNTNAMSRDLNAEINFISMHKIIYRYRNICKEEKYTIYRYIDSGIINSGVILLARFPTTRDTRRRYVASIKKRDYAYIINTLRCRLTKKREGGEERESRLRLS